MARVKKKRKKSQRVKGPKLDTTPKELEPPPRSPPTPSSGRRGFSTGGAVSAKVADNNRKNRKSRQPEASRQSEVSRQFEAPRKVVDVADDASQALKNFPLLEEPKKATPAVRVINLSKKTARTLFRARKTVASSHKTTGAKSPVAKLRSPTESKKLTALKKSIKSSQSDTSTFSKATKVAAPVNVGHKRDSRTSSFRVDEQKPETKKAGKKQISILNLTRLTRDGRKVPEFYKQTALSAGSPSQLSLGAISEFYNLGQKFDNFATIDDVFLYRGYKKQSKIDEGAFGVVSKALRLADNLTVAVKEVDLRRKRAKRIEEMKRELFVLQTVNHDNVVGLIEHFIVGQLLVIIMEFCAGGNLTSYLKETAVTEQEAMYLFQQMALSVKVLHRKGIAHRDVKLNNFLLDATRKIVKIGDFGLSVVSYRANTGVLMAKTYCGTEPYMAPELLRRNSLGLRSYNPIYADIWSLGVCLYAMLTRTFPFKMHTSQQGLLRAQVARSWRFPRFLRETLSEDLKDLIWHMLDPEPDRRITINCVIAHSWLNQQQMVQLSNPPSEYEIDVNQAAS